MEFPEAFEDEKVKRALSTDLVKQNRRRHHRESHHHHHPRREEFCSRFGFDCGCISARLLVEASLTTIPSVSSISQKVERVNVYKIMQL
jgi:hypothetical protein